MTDQHIIKRERNLLNYVKNVLYSSENIIANYDALCLLLNDSHFLDELDLADLAQSLWHDDNVTKNDVLQIIEKIENYIK